MQHFIKANIVLIKKIVVLAKICIYYSMFSGL